MTKVIKPMATPPKEERETIISYDALSGGWHIYTCEPKHARKFQQYVTHPQRQGFNRSNQLIMLEGDIDSGTVSIHKKKHYTEKQKEQYRISLQKARISHRASVHA